MYSILLVDDEDAVRSSIRTLTPWEENGFEIIGEASNGLEALDILEDGIPDVIITDIKMPYMDGIAFITEVRERFSRSVEVIILSGYDEFTFAQTAMKLGTAEYVLKPVSIESMTEVLKRAKARLDDDLARISDMKRLEAFYNDALSLYKEKFLISLIASTRLQDEALLLDKAREYGIPLSGTMFAAAAVELPPEIHFSIVMSEIIERGLDDKSDIATFQYENQVVIIFSSNLEESMTQTFKIEINRTLSLLQSTIIHYLSRPCNIGVGEVVYHLKSLPESYKSAMAALNYATIYPEQHIITLSDVENVERTTKEWTRGERKTDLVMMIKFGSEEQVKRKIREFFSSEVDTESIQSTVLSIISSIAEICSAYGRNIASLIEGEDLFILLSKANTVSRAEALSERLALAAFHMASGVRESSHIEFITKAKRIIMERYQDPLFGLETVSEAISVSPAYFSTIFKKETGTSFVQYLTDVRIEKAKEMLKNSDAKTYEIAKAIGFSEPNYFSFTFKKHVGLSPSQYRRGL